LEFTVIKNQGQIQLQTTEIEQEIRKFLSETFLLGSGETLNEDAPLLGGVIDSQGAIELVAFIQQRFGIEVEDEEVTIDNLTSVKSVTALVENKLGQK
jgi:acyl carrier protein